jgi:hypothetical protein
MYYYLFDSPLADKRYSAIVNRIEFRIIELGINGRMDRLSILKNMQELIDSAVKHGAETIVIVGDDSAIARAVSIVARYKVTLGIIPVGEHLEIPKALGIPEGEAACDVLSKRVIRTIDLGKANDQYFLFSLDVPAQQVSVECDGHYRISLLGVPRAFSICNFSTEQREHKACDPEDGLLEAIIKEEPAGWNPFKKSQAVESVFPLHTAKIVCNDASIPLTLDGGSVVKTPVTVEVAPKKLRVVVGKDRHF